MQHLPKTILVLSHKRLGKVSMQCASSRDCHGIRPYSSVPT